MSRLFLVTALCGAALVAPAETETADVTVRRAPYVVSTVSSKSTKAWAPCRYCGSKTSYERSYTWNVYRHAWVESTDKDSIPDVCRKCRAKTKDQEKLDREERDLDRRVQYQKTRRRIQSKERQLERLRKETR